MKYDEFNPLNHPILFKQPMRHTSGIYSLSWKGHIPFGMLLIELVRPQLLVELGTEKGISYCAFCQAAEFLNLPTRFYAVDSWKGDHHTGAYGSETLEDLKAFHDPHYGRFSSLLQMTFDDALDRFEDGTINLLHIDGFHTYEAIKHDFENWLPKVAPGGIILMHDVHEFKEDFGAWKFWEQVSKGRPCFKFHHSHGLGVLAIDESYPKTLKFLFEASNDEIIAIRELFDILGRRCKVEHVLQENELQSALKDKNENELQSALKDKNDKINELQSALKDKNDNELLTAHEHLNQKNKEMCKETAIKRIVSEVVQEKETAIKRILSEIKDKNDKINELQSALKDKNDDVYEKLDSNHTQLQYQHNKLRLDWILLKSNLAILKKRNMIRLTNKMLTRIKWLKYSISKKIGTLKQPVTFDEEWYRQEYPHVANRKLDPYIHYLVWGWWQGHNPNDTFDVAEYLINNPDILLEGREPYTHYLAKGAEEEQTSSDETASFDHHTTTVKIMEDVYGAYRRETEFPQYEPENDLGIAHTSIKLIAFYLPQYHPIPENDKFWGKGFTEWTNVAKTRPMFAKHYQPRLPGELGYYDTRLKEVLQRQIELAKQAGIYGFCLHHYWFNGKPLLRVPYNHIIKNTDLDIKFCLNWANEPWTAKFDGYGDCNDGNMLIEQRHHSEDDIAFIEDITPALLDKRYIKIDDRPIFLIYRPGLFPNIKKTADRWRNHCSNQGIGEIYLIGVQNTFDEVLPPKEYNFDAAVEFPPLNFPRIDVRNKVRLYDDKFPGEVLNYQAVVDAGLEFHPPDYTLFRGVMPGWDNTPRRKRCAIYANSSPELYQQWLEKVNRYTENYFREEERFVFLNAWNEWGEGAYLEPDRVFGYAYLNATARALHSLKDTKTERQRLAGRGVLLFVGHNAYRAGAQILLLDLIRWLLKHTDFEVRTLLGKGGELVDEYRKLTPTMVIEDLKSRYTGRAVLERIQDFYGPDVKLIYFNTVVSVENISLLKQIHAHTITHFHELEKSIKKFAEKDSVSIASKISSRFIAASTPVADNLINNHNIDPGIVETIHAFIAPNSVDSHRKTKNATRLRLRLPLDCIIVYGCGTRDWRKGPDLFVKVLQYLVGTGIDGFHFCWIGQSVQGEYEDLEDFVAMNHLSDHISFVGIQSNPREFFSVGDIFLLPSREDPFPLVCLEAAEYELPIVCFADAGGMPGFVEDDAGFVVPFEDIAAMADKTALLINDVALRKKMGIRAKTKLFERHVVDIAAPQVLDTIRKTAGIRPAVSIIVPAFNHSNYLPKRLESIFNQTYQDFEIVLLDDASTDNTAEILQKYADGKPYVTVSVNKVNSGTTFAQWIKGMESAQADILWIAEDDDFCEPTFLEKMLPYFNNPDVKLAYCQSNAVDDDDNILFSYHSYTSEFDPQRWNASYVAEAEEELNAGLAMKNIIPNASAVLFRRFDTSNWVASDGGMGLAGDWSFYIHAMQSGKVVFHNEHLNYHRRHENTNIHRTQFDESRFKESVRVQATVKRKFFLPKKTLAEMRNTAWGVWQEVDPEGSRDLFKLEYDELLNGKGRKIVQKTDGYCPICESDRMFVSYEGWLRDHYRCMGCFSLPKDRALRKVLNQRAPNWKALKVHEVAPNSRFLQKAAANYSSSQYHPDHPLGETVDGIRNENIENLTFEDSSIDIFVHLDVMEHIFDQLAAIREMFRVIRPGGAIFFTVPVHKDKRESVCRAKMDDNGVIDYLLPDEYHSSPVGGGKSLVVWDYGQDFIEKLNEWTTGLNVKVYHKNTTTSEMGIEGEFLDVFCIQKAP